MGILVSHFSDVNLGENEFRHKFSDEKEKKWIYDSIRFIALNSVPMR